MTKLFNDLDEIQLNTLKMSTFFYEIKPKYICYPQKKESIEKKNFQKKFIILGLEKNNTKINSLTMVFKKNLERIVELNFL